MSGDQFAGMSDSLRNRKERDGLIRKQKWRAFWLTLCSVAHIAFSTGVGGGLSGWLIENHTRNFLDRFLGGITFGIAGGLIIFLVVLLIYIRNSLRNEARGQKDSGDIGAIMFWATMVGTESFGVLGATVGLSQSEVYDWRVFALATAVTLGALIPVYWLRNKSKRTTYTGSGYQYFKEQR